MDECGLGDCHNELGEGTQITFRAPGVAEIGQLVTLKICDYHAHMLTRSDPGSYSIGFTAQPVPASANPYFKKGFE